MMFTSQVLLFAGGTIVIATVEKIADLYGFEKVGGFVKVVLPIVAIGAAVYFLEFNPMLKWIGL